MDAHERESEAEQKLFGVSSPVASGMGSDLALLEIKTRHVACQRCVTRRVMFVAVTLDMC